ncbi:PIN domain-containing protein [Streptomyces sp. IBSBF 2950]|uniref:PIN domain-containing protein n=1 Tax=Streptomyces sp. IBSBF 2950 TaxID=2903528 RepID=UPI002FDC4F0D
MIVLDTNQLRHAAFPHGTVLGMLRKIAALGGHTLALPEMVVVEHVAHHRHEVEQSLTLARKALSTLGKAFGQDLTEHVASLSAEDAVQKRRAELEESFTLLSNPSGAADEALAREANRRAPAEQVWEDNEGKPVKAHGARDALIWLTLLETAAQADEDIWFVSMDRDFGNDGKSDFHDVLRGEAQAKLGENAGRLRLINGGIDQLLTELATPAKAPENLENLLRSNLVAHAVHIAMRGPDLFMTLLPVGSGATHGFTSQGLRLDESRVLRHKAYEVDGRIWVSAQMVCRGTKTYQYRAVEDGISWPRIAKVRFRFEATTLLELENGQAHSAEVVSHGPIIVEETTHQRDEIPLGPIEMTLPRIE